MIRHDSHVRTDWLNVGMSRAKAAKLAAEATSIIDSEGGDFTARARSHSGRRDSGCDFIAVTSPGGWNENHAGSATVKVRGCDGFRRYALTVLHRIVDEKAEENTPKIVRDYFGPGRVDATQTFHPVVGWRDFGSTPITMHLAHRLEADGFTKVAITLFGSNRTADFAIRELLSKGA